MGTQSVARTNQSNQKDVELLGRYVILEEIYRDELVLVNRAFETLPGGGLREVALKRVHSQAQGRDALRFDVFLNDASYDHPNISRVCDYGRTCGTYFISTEYVEGHSLRELIDNSWSPPPIHITTLILQQLCDAIHFFHQNDLAGLGRLNLDPATLILGSDGLLRITDTASCLPGAGRGHSSHLIALGEIAYELLCLMPAPSTRDAPETLRPSILNPLCPPALDALVMRALSGDFRHAGELVYALVLTASQAYEKPTPEALAQWQRSHFHGKNPRPQKPRLEISPQAQPTYLGGQSFVAPRASIKRDANGPKTLIRMPLPGPLLAKSRTQPCPSSVSVNVDFSGTASKKRSHPRGRTRSLRVAKGTRPRQHDAQPPARARQEAPQELAPAETEAAASSATPEPRKARVAMGLVLALATMAGVFLAAMYLASPY